MEPSKAKPLSALDRAIDAPKVQAQWREERQAEAFPRWGDARKHRPERAVAKKGGTPGTKHEAVARPEQGRETGQFPTAAQTRSCSQSPDLLLEYPDHFFQELDLLIGICLNPFNGVQVALNIH